MSYQIAFPEIEPALMPQLPEGWTDSSWRNDACPCYMPRDGVEVWIDPAREAMDTVYCVALRDAEGDFFDDVYQGDSWEDARDVATVLSECDAILARQIATRFTLGLMNYATEAQWDEMRAKVLAYRAEGICPSHDFCDANQFMIDAFDYVMKREIDLQSDSDRALLHAAWTVAQLSWVNMPHS